MRAEKEEILEMNYALHEERIQYPSAVYDAMEQYAKEVAIEFNEWCHFNYNRSNVVGFWYPQGKFIEDEPIQTSELFELFKKENINQ